ncbi:MAG: hypothetical protein QOE70_4588 [Chthoniobacter sp.]|jgi:Uma2 family endonuclease|nr:hypothetical protein [Chthoniobacter sp.]
MADILEMPEVRARVSRLSVAEYHQLGEYNENGRPTELIRGIVIEKTSKSPVHASIQTLLPDFIKTMVPPGFLVRIDNPLTFLDSEPEPDLAVVRGTLRDFFASHPTTADLVVEVAVSSVALDRENASLYAEACVQEYWIVLARQQQVEVYRRPEQGVYREQRVYARDETLVCESVPSIRLELADLFLS